MIGTKAIQLNLLAREAGLLVAGTVLAGGYLALGWAEADLLVAIIATVQLGVYLITTFRRVFNHIGHEDMSISKCLASLGLMTAFFVFAYGINYTLLTLADTDALKNFSPAGFGYRLLDGWYFSTVVFTATGFGEYVPITYPAKLIVWGEMVLGFTTTVFAISSFISLTNRN